MNKKRPQQVYGGKGWYIFALCLTIWLAIGILAYDLVSDAVINDVAGTEMMT